MSDISLLPEGLRGKEQAVQKQKAPTLTGGEGGIKMHVPTSTADEDIEIIEVDESDLGAILADEPLFTRLSYQLSVALDGLKQKLFASNEAAPPPKLPPQFFTPPKAGLVTKPGGATFPAGATAPTPASAVGATRRPGTRITPSGEAPRRVRVIRRVRKPVRITLLSPEELLAYRVDVPRRKWTMAVCAGLFTLVIGGGYWLLETRVADAQGKLDGLNADLATVRADIAMKEREWDRYRDLQVRLTALDGILNTHIITSRMLDFLERWTSPEVSYQSASWSPEGSLSLEVTASSYDAAARQLVAFQRSPIVLGLTALSFSGQAGEEDPALREAASSQAPAGGAASAQEINTGVSFPLALQLDASVFRGPFVSPGLSPAPVSASASSTGSAPAPASL